jgi:hypothetical protein
MKKHLLLLFLIGFIPTVYSSPLFYTNEQNSKQTNCTDTLNVSANIVNPLKITFVPIMKGLVDNIELKIVDDTLTNHQVTHFTKHVTAQCDTIIYLQPGTYYLVFMGGGASLQNPILSGESISVNNEGWTGMTNYVALPFKVIAQSIVCEGQALLNASPYYSGTGKLKYKWTPSTGLNNDTIQNPTATILNNITYTVTVTSPNGCTATNPVNITISPLAVNSGAINTVVCGGSVQISNVTTNYSGTGSLKYKWTPSTGLDNDTISNPTSTVTSDITYSVTVTTPTGCTVTGNFSVLVTPLSVNAGGDKTIQCGSTVQLNGAATNFTGSGILKYKWIPTTGLNNDTIANPTATVFNNITYSCSVTTPNGCSGSDNVAIKITPMAQPVIGIVGVSSSNKNIIVWNKPVSTGIESYFIYRETNVSDTYEKIGSVPYDSLSVFVDSLSAPDVKSNKYKLSILDRSGLESPLSDSHKTMHLSINKGQNSTWNLIWEPYEGFTASTYNIYRGTNPNSLNFLDATSGSSTQYSDITALAGDVYYQLEVISPTIISPTKSAATIQKIKDSGNVTGTIQTSYMSSRSNIATSVISGINELKGESTNIILYPNPVKDELKIDFAGGSVFEILNLTGQVIYNGNITKNAIIRTSGLSAGVYLIRFQTGTTYEYKKIIKE